MPAVPSFIINPLWDQFAALLPKRQVCHPLGCHRPRISDRIVFDKLVQVLVLGIAYAKIADSTCYAITLRARRDEWITAGLFARLEQLCLEAYDRITGLDLNQLGRFELRFGLGLPPVITVHLDAGYDSAKTRDLLDELGCHGVISTKRTPLRAGARWVVGRTNS